MAGKGLRFRLTTDTITMTLPEEGEEVMQKLSIFEDGRCWLSRYCYFLEEEELFTFTGKEMFRIPAETVKDIIKKISRRCETAELFFGVMDAGTWKLELYKPDGGKISRSGSLMEQPGGEGENLSEWMRELLGREDLFLFDGNARPK